MKTIGRVTQGAGPRLKGALVLVTAALTACTSTGERPSQARVRIVQDPHVDTMRMWIAELPELCLPARLEEVSGRVDLQARARGELGMPRPPAGSAVFSERLVPAGRRFAFASDFDPNGTPGKFRSCYVGTAFVPEAGADYEIRVQLVPGGCEHTVRQFGPDGVPDIAAPMSHVMWSCPATPAGGMGR